MYHISSFWSNFRVLTDDQGKDIAMNFDHGTTTLGFKYQGGVVLAVDSRATGGMYIGSGSVKKIIEINKFLLGTMAGGAADCTYWVWDGDDADEQHDYVQGAVKAVQAVRAPQQGEDKRCSCQ